MRSQILGASDLDILSFLSSLGMVFSMGGYLFEAEKNLFMAYEEFNLILESNYPFFYTCNRKSRNSAGLLAQL